MKFPDDGELTIASGAVTPTGVFHSLDTEANAASDDLDTISGGVDGQILILETENSGRDVVVTNSGNIVTQDGLNFTLDSTNNTALLIYSGALTKWKVISPGKQPKFRQLTFAHKSDTFSSTSASFVDVTGLSASITPQSTSNYVKVTVSLSIAHNTTTDSNAFVKLLRDSTEIGNGDSDGANRVECFAVGSVADDNKITTVHRTYIDSPASVSALTYKIQVAPSNGGDVHINRSHNDSNATSQARVSSSILLEEIAP